MERYWRKLVSTDYWFILLYHCNSGFECSASNATAIAGATLVFTQAATQAAYTTQTIILPAALAGTTVRLIFTWQNDNSGGANPAAAVDNISLTYLQSYIDQFSALTNAGSPWCPGETRSVSVTVKNIGSATWVSGGSGVNFSYWWSKSIRP